MPISFFTCFQNCPQKTNSSYLNVHRLGTNTLADRNAPHCIKKYTWPLVTRAHCDFIIKKKTPCIIVIVTYSIIIKKALRARIIIRYSGQHVASGVRDLKKKKDVRMEKIWRLKRIRGVTRDLVVLLCVYFSIFLVQNRSR